MARKTVDPSKNRLYYGDNLEVLREGDVHAVAAERPGDAPTGLYL